MEVRQAEEEIFETPDLLDEGEGGGSTAAAIRLSRGLYQERETDPESLVPTSIDADSAFEVFHGKVYDSHGVDLSGSIARAGVLGATAREGSLLPPRDKPVETPIDRYLRLKAETSQLSDDLVALTASDKEREAVGAADLGDSTVWQHLAGQVSSLKDELVALAGEPGLAAGGNGSGFLPQASASLTEDLLRRVGELGKEAVESTSTASNSGGGVAEGKGKEVVYELYYDPSRASARASKLQAVEARIAALEKVVARSDESEGGGLSAAAGIVLTSKTQSLSEAIAKLEKQMSLLDSSSNETIRQRLVLLKNEWDDFKRERSKHGAAVDVQASAHHRRVESLYESLKKLEPVAGDLPTLVSRLQVLQDLHAQSLDFSQRLSQLGTGQDVLRDLLKSTADNLQEVRQSLSDNVTQLAENIKAVDTRIERLEKNRR